MKAVDTNVLVRYLVQDDPRQGKKAAAYIEGAARAAEPILIGNIVLCETAWVLDSAYGYSRAEIHSALEKILQASTFQFEAKDLLWAALEQYRSIKADFADCLIGQIHKAFGCEPTVTFDSALQKPSTFQLL